MSAVAAVAEEVKAPSAAESNRAKAQVLNDICAKLEAASKGLDVMISNLDRASDLSDRWIDAWRDMPGHGEHAARASVESEEKEATKAAKAGEAAKPKKRTRGKVAAAKGGANTRRKR